MLEPPAARMTGAECRSRAARSAGIRPAVFLDRDGTLIEDVPFIRDPSDVVLRPFAAEALAALQSARFALVVVTNQSGIGRGLLTEAEYSAVTERMSELLRARGVALDGTYFCPDIPPSAGRHDFCSPDRKPGPGMLLRAAADLQLDLGTSWMVGDRPSDAVAGWNAGCRGAILLGTVGGGLPGGLDGFCRRAGDLAAAAYQILSAPGPRGGQAKTM